jgi:prevent-host-death family protein
MKSVSKVAVNIHEAKAKLSQLLEQALAGDEVIIMRAGKHLVKLVPVINAPVRRQVGTAIGAFTVPDDFNTELDDEMLAAFGAK